MTETATRSARRPAKGGAENLLLVCASIESTPAELHGIADEVHASLPWGRLLRGIVLGEPDVCGGLRAIARPGAVLDVTVGTSIWRDPVPLEVRDLPELTEAYARDVLADRLAACGWRLTEVGTRSGDMSSSWGRRLGSSAAESFVYLRAEAC
jgi:16S rRNA (adenine(1408)-N(1))-methyltransferase